MYAVSDEDIELLRQLTQASGRPVTWLALFAHPGQPDFHDQTFARLGDLREAGHSAGDAAADHEPGRPQEPDDVRLVRLAGRRRSTGPRPSRSRSTGIPTFREAFRQELESRKRSHMWGQMRVLEVGRAGARRQRGAHARGDRRRPGQAAGRRLLRPRHRRRSRDALPVLHVQLRPGRRRAADHRRPLPDRPLRRRRARRLHLRRGLRHRAARPLGAPAQGAEPGEGRAQADAGAGDAVRHSQPRRAGRGQGGRPRAVRSRHGDGRRRRSTPTTCRATAGGSSRSPRASRRRSCPASSSTTTASTRARCRAASSAATRNRSPS